MTAAGGALLAVLRRGRVDEAVGAGALGAVRLARDRRRGMAVVRVVRAVGAVGAVEDQQSCCWRRAVWGGGSRDSGRQGEGGVVSGAEESAWEGCMWCMGEEAAWARATTTYEVGRRLALAAGHWLPRRTAAGGGKLQSRRRISHIPGSIAMAFVSPVVGCIRLVVIGAEPPRALMRAVRHGERCGVQRVNGKWLVRPWA